MFGENWTATYYNSTDLSGQVVYTELLPNGINHNWGIGSPSPAVNVDNFSARFVSQQLFDAAIYEFVISSDAGVRVFINERVILDQFYVRTLTTDRVRVRMMSEGNYALKIEYFAAVGQAAIQVQWYNADYFVKLEQSTTVANLFPRLTSDPVKMAITDAEMFVQAGRPTSAVDRVHTALHGYLRLACDSSEIIYDKDASISSLLKLLRQKHPALKAASDHQQIGEILNSFGEILHNLNILRNHASLAHANPSLLEQEDATLAINATRSILHYLDAKFSKS